MSKDKKQDLSEVEGLIPELRFPEFVNEGEWEEITIEKVGDVVTGGTPSKEENEYWGGDFVWVTAQDFKEKYIYNSVLKLTKKGKDKSRVIPKNSVLVTCIASIGLNGINKVECATNQQINSVICNSSNHYEFVYYSISKNITRLKNLAGQTAVPIISKSVFEKFTIQKPQKPEEQQKIASCLTSLDEVITAHSQKLDALKEHKKGLMQNLFPQEGEKVPKYRFPEFKNDGEWVETKLGDAAAFINGRAYKQEELLEKGKYRVLRVGNFFTNNNWYYSDLELEADKYCDDGDLLYAWSASFGPRVWKGEKVIYHYHIWKVLPNTSTAKDFLYVLLDNETERMKTQNANGFALLHITKGTIENWKCNIPKSKVEQNKIASCLSTLDALITAQAEKIEQLKLHKKGLMQGLFPKIND